MDLNAGELEVGFVLKKASSEENLTGTVISGECISTDPRSDPKSDRTQRNAT